RSRPSSQRCEAEQSSGIRSLQPKNQVGCLPLVTAIADPLGVRRGLIQVESQAIDRTALEEPQFDCASGLNHVFCPPLAESRGSGNQWIDCFWFRCNRNCMYHSV